jgi:hypothetical protein
LVARLCFASIITWHALRAVVSRRVILGDDESHDRDRHLQHVSAESVQKSALLVHGVDDDRKDFQLGRIQACIREFAPILAGYAKPIPVRDFGFRALRNVSPEALGYARIEFFNSIQTPAGALTQPTLPDTHDGNWAACTPAMRPKVAARQMPCWPKPPAESPQA